MIEKLFTRIRLMTEEVGDCWEWRGAMQSHAPVPMMKWRGVSKAVRRHILEEQGVPLQGKLATQSCGNQHCVNPEHVIPMTRKRLQQRLAKERNYYTSALFRKRVSDQARKTAKITMAIAQEIREADGTQREIAAQFGVSQATVSSIRRGRTWLDFNNHFVHLFPPSRK